MTGRRVRAPVGDDAVALGAPGAPGAPSATQGVSRRRFLAGAASLTGATIVGGALGYAGALALNPGGQTSSVGGPDQIVPFRGLRQAGIATPVQSRLAIAAFDVTGASRADLAALLQTWTSAAELMAAGEPVGDPTAAPLAPAVDTGEAVGLLPANLTVTIGFGPSLFDGRFGLASRRPAALADIPALPGDFLDPAISNGDIVIQACSDDPQVSFHAVRNLARLGRGTAVVRWFQLGFGRTSKTSSAQETPRNLQGFKDGTNNVLAEQADDMDRFVWVGAERDQDWMRGGSYMVTRRIRMLVEAWDRAGFQDQQNVIGRRKISGAPLGATAEHDTVDLAAAGPDGTPLIPADAHIRLAAPSNHGGLRILRRGYSFTDGIDPVTGQLDAGLFFICFQKDPRAQFVPIQRTLGAQDALNEYIRHVSSGVFACPPGLAPGEWWGQRLLG